MLRLPAKTIMRRSIPTPRPPVGGIPVLDRRQELLVEAVGVLVLEPASEQFLLLHALPLVERIVQFGEGVANLHTGDEALEPLHQA